MRTVNVAELKNRLSTFLGYAKNGEVIVIRDRNLHVARRSRLPLRTRARKTWLLPQAVSSGCRQSPWIWTGLAKCPAPLFVEPPPHKPFWTKEKKESETQHDFLDSSALIPLCVQGQTSAKVRALATQFAPVVWWATAVEIHSTIARLFRAGQLADAGRKAALDRLTVVRDGWRKVLPSEKLRDQAAALLDAHSLRAADSLQLAAALIWRQPRDVQRRFISNDRHLCEAARQ